MATKEKVWFISGSSRGFGRVWTEAALRRGDKVVATARKLASISDLKEQYGDLVLPLQMDVTVPEQVHAAVQKAHEHFGRLDVVLNNAGYSLVGTIEEPSTEEIRAMYETNIFGTIHVLQAALPILRAQGYGHILGTSSALGHYSVPVIGYYCSSKWAFEALHESLQAEIASFGIKVTIIEPGAYATEFGSKESLRIAENQLEAYETLKTTIFTNLQHMERGNPSATDQAILAVVDAENPPLRLLLGKNELPIIEKAYAQRVNIWKEWEAVSKAAQG